MRNVLLRWKDYTALESWKTHVEIYTNHGHSIEEHDNYQIVTSSITRYEATKHVPAVGVRLIMILYNN